MSEITYAGVMPVLALRGLAVFPEQTVHFDVGRTKSALALEAAMKKDQVLQQYQFFVGTSPTPISTVSEPAPEKVLRSGENFYL